MKLFFIILLFCTGYYFDKNAGHLMTNTSYQKQYTYLALGDSYTIGESVPSTDNFPNQVAALLQSDSIAIAMPEIIAKTGWRTDNLKNAIEKAQNELLPAYDFVSLLIGVNDQYQEIDFKNYMPAFEALLKKSIQLAGDKPDHVAVLSIPDWGVTPFAEGRDRAGIAHDIDEYNAVNKTVAAQYHVFYIDITGFTREAANDPSLVTHDGLHPSGKEYKRWAEKIAAFYKTKQ